MSEQGAKGSTIGRIETARGSLGPRPRQIFGLLTDVSLKRSKVVCKRVFRQATFWTYQIHRNPVPCLDMFMCPLLSSHIVSVCLLWAYQRLGSQAFGSRHKSYKKASSSSAGLSRFLITFNLWEFFIDPKIPRRLFEQPEHAQLEQHFVCKLPGGGLN